MKSLFASLLLGGALLLPLSASAFNLENGTTVQLNADTWLHVNTIELGSDERTSVPIAAEPNWVPRISGEYLRYQVLLAGQPYAGLDSSGLVLSDAPIEDNHYVIPAGEAYDFTFITFLTIPAAQSVTDVAVEVTTF
jgi:hypothetical protein